MDTSRGEAGNATPHASGRGTGDKDKGTSQSTNVRLASHSGWEPGHRNPAPDPYECLKVDLRRIVDSIRGASLASTAKRDEHRKSLVDVYPEVCCRHARSRIERTMNSHCAPPYRAA